MVAIATPAPSAAPRIVRPAPRLRVVAPTQPRRGVSWGRLAGIAAVAVVVAAAALFLLQADPTPAPGTVPLLEATHTVAEGETMWSIANQVAPAGEAATYVERLVAANGSATVTPGEVLALPVP